MKNLLRASMKVFQTKVTGDVSYPITNNKKADHEVIMKVSVESQSMYVEACKSKAPQNLKPQGCN